MARPKEEKMELSEAYYVDALLLAGQYADMLREKEYYEKAFAGVQLYTTEMAIDELSGSAYSDSERVQTSNISKPTERIALLLADGYVERKNAEIVQELLTQGAEYDDLCKKIDIIEVAMRERMEDRTRTVFLQLYAEEKKYSRVRYDCSNKCHNLVIQREKKKHLRQLQKSWNYENTIKIQHQKENKYGTQKKRTSFSTRRECSVRCGTR